MMNLIKSICIITVALTAISCDKNLNTDSRFEEGIDKALAGNVSSATKSFIHSYKSKTEPHKSLVAISVLNKLQKELIDSHSSYFFFSALNKLTTNNIDGAKADVEKAAAAELNFSEAHILRAIISEEQRDYISALNDYSRAITMNPDKFNFVYNELGLTNAYLGNFTEATANFEKAINNDPNYVYAYFNKANTQSILNKREEAIEFYSKALSIVPDFMRLFFSELMPTLI